ncbi:hypothetical protein D3C86_1899450 [compost metagenome]
MAKPPTSASSLEIKEEENIFIYPQHFSLESIIEIKYPTSLDFTQSLGNSPFIVTIFNEPLLYLSVKRVIKAFGSKSFGAKVL